MVWDDLGRQPEGWLYLVYDNYENGLAQGVPGSPTCAAFARVGVVKPWVKWEKLTSPFRDGTVLTHPRQALVTFRMRRYLDG